MTVSSSNFSRYINTETWEIGREIFSDPEIYRREQEQIFARAWLYVGHESQIREPGDFILSRMGEESVIVTRDKNSQIRVMLNSCRHRGMKVCRYDEGNTTKFYCPYHAWTYDLEGKLVNVQLYDELYKPPFDKSQWGLVQVAKIATLGGTIWATWDPDAPDFDTYIGEARHALELTFRPTDGGNGEIEMLGGIQKWQINSNWKMVAENGAGDTLHGPSHASVDMAGIAPSAERDGRKDWLGDLHSAAYPGGHAFLYNKWPMDKERVDYRREPIVAEWFKEKWRLRVERMGKSAGIWTRLGGVFPNMSFHAQQPRTVIVAHPAGPQKTEAWRVYFVDRDAPPEVKAWLRRYYLSYSGPGGMTEQDDMENWQYATKSTTGVVAQRYPFHYTSGLGMGGPDSEIPGLVRAGRGSEQNARAVLVRWAELMDAPSWGDLLSKRPQALV